MGKVTYTFCPVCAAPLVDREGPSGSRRACVADGCGFVHHDNPTPIVAAVVQRGEEVVLVRNIGWPETWYGLVSGFLERGEDPEAGVRREVREELGVEGQVVSLIGAYPFAQMNELILAYHVRLDEEAEITPDLTELADTKRVPIAKLRPWPFGTGHAVRDWLAAQLAASQG